MSVTVVGMGPGPVSLLTQEAWAVLAGAADVYARTRRHPVLTHLAGRAQLHTLDSVLEGVGDRGQAAEALAAELVRLGERPEGVVYAVPGHPLVGDATVAALLARCRRVGVAYRLVHGLSPLEPACSALGIDPVAAGLQLVDALAPQLEPGRPALVLNLAERAEADDLQAALLNLYPADHRLALVWLGEETVVQEMTLAQLGDLADLDCSACLYLPPLPLTRDLHSFGGLRRLIAHLRGPQGCPWDRAQTHASLKPFLLEEAYEALEALDEGDPARLGEELGDLLLEVLLHVQLAEEADEFRLGDVIYSIASKLVRRHPHVFGQEVAATPEQVMNRWQALKQAERGDDASALEGVPSTMPALAYSQALLARAAAVGFQWPGLDQVVDKLAEEVRELAATPTIEERRQEMGDILINVANAARYLGLDAEEALRLAAHKFRRRFMVVEGLARERGLTLSRLAFADLEALWQEAKERLASF